jgi:hypothetical protein
MMLKEGDDPGDLFQRFSVLAEVSYKDQIKIEAHLRFDDVARTVWPSGKGFCRVVDPILFYVHNTQDHFFEQAVIRCAVQIHEAARNHP